MYEPPPLGYAKIVWRYDVATIASRIATVIAIGTSFESPSARLDGATAMTNRISSVAYAVDEIASDENTAERDRLAEALMLLLGRRERATDEHALYGVEQLPFPSG